MRTNPEFWSDEFESIDDADLSMDIDDVVEATVDEALLQLEQRRRTTWQRLEERLSDYQLRAELEDWDEYLVAH